MYHYMDTFPFPRLRYRSFKRFQIQRRGDTAGFGLASRLAMNTSSGVPCKLHRSVNSSSCRYTVGAHKNWEVKLLVTKFRCIMLLHNGSGLFSWPDMNTFETGQECPTCGAIWLERDNVSTQPLMLVWRGVQYKPGFPAVWIKIHFAHKQTISEH
jgi:hypothetical protein